MASTAQATPLFRRALVLMTASSFMIPAAGLLTAPILARALGVDGRGELAAALAPSALMLAVATLGLPEALTYHIAKRPRVTRPAVLWCSLITVALGGLCVAIVWAALPFLSAGDAELAHLLLLATVVTVPALVVGVLRGAASGRQMWDAVAVERVLNSSLRVVVLGGLWLAGELTVFVAVLVSALIPVASGVVYWRLFVIEPVDPAESPFTAATLSTIVSFGSRAWLGSVASMTLARLAFLFMAPLSSVEDLGLYTVATTISDLPLVVAMAIQSTLYGVDSRSVNVDRLTTTTRLAVLVGLIGCSVLGATLPLWIGPLFGAEFTAATVPTIMLLVSAVICIPGLLAASGVAAAGRPGLRSLGLVVTLLANASAFVLLVPTLGVYGACWTSIIGNVVMTGFMVIAASRLLGVGARQFLLPQPKDVWLVGRETKRLVRRLGRARSDA